MDLLESLESNKARLTINIKAHVDWALPPEDTTEMLSRYDIDIKINQFSFNLEKDIEQLILEHIEEYRNGTTNIDAGA